MDQIEDIKAKQKLQIMIWVEKIENKISPNLDVRINIYW